MSSRKCPRCRGLMFYETFHTSDGSWDGRHCVLCGEILDPVIILHRLSGDPRLDIPEDPQKLMKLLARVERRRHANV